MVRAASALPVGASAVVPLEDSAWLVRLAARQDGEVAAFDEVRAEVLGEWRHDADDQRLRRWLDARRAQARVVVREPLP